MDFEERILAHDFVQEASMNTFRRMSFGPCQEKLQSTESIFSF